MRTLGIARALRRLVPETQFLFLTNSDAPHLISRDSFPVVKMLSPKPGPEDGRNDEARKINLGVAQATITRFDPDVIAVDFFPQGQLGSLAWIGQHRARKIFIAREPHPADPHGARRNAQIEAIHDVIIAPHRPDEQVKMETSKPVHYVGPILVRSRDEAMPRSQARRALGVPADAFLVYVGFGGGGRPDIIQSRNWILSVCGRFPQWTFAVARPPLDYGPPLDLGAANAIEFSYAPLAECWPAFDLAISGLSYNSTAELLHQGVPTLFVELKEPWDDWARRGRMIADAGAGLTIRFGDEEALITSLETLASASRREVIAKAARDMIPENGASRAAAVILEEARRIGIS
jgi:UDP:flavonoid glycosyltransferase YjiC (YdhE family)